ncbi:MAG: aminotransferase class IV, partial [Pseudomonadota bacterium]
MLGDGVWEGLRLHKRRWVFLEAHLDRLYEAALALDLDIRMSKAALAEALDETAAANGMTGDAHARLMVTRGIKKRPFQDPRLSVTGPTVVIIAEHSRPSSHLAAQGIRLHTVPNHRGLPLTQDPKLNSHSKLNCILAGIHAQKAGADEALMLDPHGFVNTTNSCNFFVIRRGEVWTSAGDYCMPGITRAAVIRLCRENRIPIFERNYSLLDCYSADEAFMTGSFGGPTRVAEIDGRTIGSNGPGPMLSRIRRLYRELVDRYCAEAAD